MSVSTISVFHILKIGTAFIAINESLNEGNLDFDYVTGDGLYYNVQVGADTVRKKCSGIVNSISLYFCGESWYGSPSSYGTFEMDINVQGYKTLCRNVSVLIRIAAVSLVGFKANGDTVLLASSIGNLSNIDISDYITVRQRAQPSSDNASYVGVFILKDK